jgi:23S rRNA (guanine2445-N2)-methyltransferase / 23S rRNA (guanine2069-N7)-methyltransferase
MSHYFATCPKGLEYLLRDELIAIGASDVREALAGAHFSGTLETAYRACLWSRLASRILLPLAEFDAADDDALYRGVQDIDWSQHLAAHATFAVDAGTALSKLTHSQFIGLRVKDAVVDQFRQRDGNRPGIDTDEPDLRINLRLRRDRATVSLDLAGSPLHRPRSAGRGAIEGEPRRRDAFARALAGGLRRRRCVARSDVRFGHAADRRRPYGSRRGTRPAPRVFRFPRLAAA